MKGLLALLHTVYQAFKERGRERQNHFEAVAEICRAQPSLKGLFALSHTVYRAFKDTGREGGRERGEGGRGEREGGREG